MKCLPKPCSGGCKEADMTDHYAGGACGTPYCSWHETHCRRCGWFTTRCGCGSENGQDRISTKARRGMAKLHPSRPLGCPPMALECPRTHDRGGWWYGCTSRVSVTERHAG